MQQSMRKILVVEDNALNRRILVNMLSPSYEILEAENGLEALNILGQYGELISLVLLDIIIQSQIGRASCRERV